MNQDRRAGTGLDRLPGELVDWLAKPFASFLRIEAAGGGHGHDTRRALAQGEEAVHRSEALLDQMSGLPTAGCLAVVRGRRGLQLTGLEP